VVRARERLREHELLAISDGNRERSASQLERHVHALGQTGAYAILEHNAINDDLDRVLELLVELDLLIQRPHLCVHPNASESFAAKFFEELPKLALTTLHNRGEHLELRPGIKLEDRVDYLLGTLFLDELAANRAMRNADAGEQQSEVVIDLGNGTDRGSRVARGRLLVD